MTIKPSRNKIFANATIGIALIHSQTGVIIQVNDEYCKMLQRSRNDVVGNTWMQFTAPDDLPRDERLLADIFSNANSHGLTRKRYVHPDGAIVFANLIVVPVVLNSDKRSHLVMVKSYSCDFIDDDKQSYIIDNLLSSDTVFNALVMLSLSTHRETAGHLYRTRNYIKILLENMPSLSDYSPDEKRMISETAMLHDIGKVGIPADILYKKNPLSLAEFTVIKTHTTMGGQVIDNIRTYIKNDPWLSFAREIIELHHERWDGTGYPYGLQGTQIPVSARLMAIADVYGALRSERIYKRAISHREAVRIITNESGTHFDPAIVAVFNRLEDVFEEITYICGFYDL